METGSVTLGLEDGTIDVERLLVEPQDGHTSMDNVICFNKKISDNMEEVSRNFGGLNVGIARTGEDILSREVLDAMPSESQGGYFQLQNDFCSMGDEYLLGVEFAESITNFDFGSSEGLRTSVSDGSFSAASSDTPWKSDLFGILEVPECHNSQLNNSTSELNTHNQNECDKLPEEKPPTLPDISSCSFRDVLSYDIDATFSRSDEIFDSSKKIDKFEAEKKLALTSNIDAIPTQKRSRKPTQRYIDELTDPFSKFSKKRREDSSTSTVKYNKCVGVKDHKTLHMGSRAVKLPAEESSVVAIQVPFGSLGHKECAKTYPSDTVHTLDSGNLIPKSKDSRITPETHKKRDESIPSITPKRMDDFALATVQKKRNKCVTTSGHLKKRDHHPIISVSQKKRADFFASSPQKNRDDSFSSESPEEVNGRRKHHRLWTILEVKKLLDGVSQYGVGSWSRIKKLLFSASAHRTSVDLKDKWRNLLKASGIYEQGNPQGEKKRNTAWRPLPKSIIRRVRELAALHPYPKSRKPKNGHTHNHDSPDRSSEITLSDYKRILRSIDGN